MSAVRVLPLGGLGEIGKNLMVVELDERIIVVDVGLRFPTPDMIGIDLVLPDFSYLSRRARDIEAIVVTHGHEDHLGALPFILRELGERGGDEGTYPPVFGGPLTIAMARSKLEEQRLEDADLRELATAQPLQLGPFSLELVHMTHSIPDSCAVALRTELGVVLLTGDYKFDQTPVDGPPADVSRLAELGRDGVLLLCGDSTNVDRPGFSPSESLVGPSLEDVFARCEGRIVVTSFASNIHRVQQALDAAAALDRKVALVGRSMRKNVGIGRSLGHIEVPDGLLVGPGEIDDLPDERIVVISTGSQGEPLSALALMAAGENKWVKVGEGDVVILSSHAIPGNEYSVNKVIDGLRRLGAEVVHAGVAEVHVTGHAQQRELETLLSIARPDFFVPVHGEFRHLTHHARLAMEMGVPAANVLLAEDGDVIELGDDGIEFVDEVPAGYLYVDGIVGDVGHGVLRDRRVLAEEGMVVVVVTVDAHSGEVISGPEIITRGWVHAPEAEDLLEEARAVVLASLEAAADEGATDFETLRRHARQSLGKFVNERTRRRPMIVPVVMEA